MMKIVPNNERNEIMQQVKLGMVGAGGIATMHSNNLLRIAEARVTAVCDLDLNRAETLSKLLGASAYIDIEEMLNKENFDGMLFFTPPSCRVENLMKVIRRKIPVFIEKPAADYVDIAEEIADLIDEYEVINAIGYMWRSSSCLTKMKQLIGGRKVGVVHGNTISRVGYGSKYYDKAATGVQIKEQTTHILNVAQSLVGEASTISTVGTMGRLMQADWLKTEDVSSMSVLYKNGAVGSFTNCFLYEGDSIFSLDACGQNFALTFDMGNNRLSGTVDHIRIDYQGPENPYETEMRNFIKAIRASDQSYNACPYREGIHALKMTLLAEVALSSGRAESF